MKNESIVSWIESLNKNKVSFIVPTIKGRDAFLKRLLDVLYNNVELLKNYGIDYEIIIVFDGFDVPEYIHEEYKYILNIIEVPILEDQSGTVSIPRNIGISYASGAVIAPTDDDVYPTSNKMKMIESLINSRNKKQTGINGKEIGLIYGSRREEIISTNYTVTGEGQNEVVTIRTPRPVLDQRDIMHWVFNKEDLGIDNGQFVYSADVYQHIDILFPVNACDWELYSLIAKYYDFDCFNNKQHVSLYTWHDQNISRTQKAHRIDPKKILHKYIKYFSNKSWKNLIMENYGSLYDFNTTSGV